jgi:septum formation protein
MTGTVGAVPKLVLASASRSRRDVLARAGIAAEAVPARVDESEIKNALKAEGAPAITVVETLGELKARRVSRRYPGSLVIGADQMLVCGDTWFDKPADLDEAVRHLKALRGRTHELATSVSVLRDEVRLWHHNETPRLTAWPFSDAFISDYLAAAGTAVLESVGAYQLEGLGAQLFSRIEGDFFTILGLPLLPLMAFLREHRVLGS